MVVSAEVETAPATTRPARRRGRRLSRLVSLASLAWLAFVVLHRLLSGRVWWWALLELMPPLAFVAVPALLLALLPAARGARRWVAGSAVAAALAGGGLTGFNVATLWHQPDPPPSDAVTVFSWNTWYWDQRAEDGATGPPPGGTPAEDTADFYRFLRAQSADVYLLQEYLYLDGEREPAPVGDLAGLQRAFPDYQIATAGELVTLSRLPIVARRPIDLRPWLADDNLVSAAPPLMPFHTVKLLRTDVRIGAETLSFYNTHLHAPLEPVLDRLGPSRLSRAHQLRMAELGALAADLTTNPYPALVAGDLNTSPAMGALGTLPDRLVDASAAMSSLYPASWDERLLRLWRIDWVFATPEVAVHRYRMVRSGGLSDHSGQHFVISVGD